jgi:hypothetical protein
MTKYEKINFKGGKAILVHGFSPWSVGSVVLGPVAGQNIMGWST